MKTIKLLSLAFATVLAFSANAQIKSPQPSPVAKVEQKVGLTDFTVEYARPGKKDRAIFGELVPFDKMWRTGANASTKVEISDNIKINGAELKAGKYALYTIPGKEEWTIIFHNNLTYWGIGDYKEDEDALRIKVKPTTTTNIVESFTIDFGSFTTTGANLLLSWDNVSVVIPIETDAKAQIEKQIKEVLVDGPSAGSYASGARYYIENDMDNDQALVWITKAIEKRADAFWYVHDKAKLLAKMGNKKEAIAAANKSIEVAKTSKNGDYGYIERNEKLIESLK